MKYSIRSDIIIETVCGQERRKKTSAKKSSTSEVTERREAKISINIPKGYIMVVLNEEIT